MVLSGSVSKSYSHVRSSWSRFRSVPSTLPIAAAAAATPVLHRCLRQVTRPKPYAVRLLLVVGMKKKTRCRRVWCELVSHMLVFSSIVFDHSLPHTHTQYTLLPFIHSFTEGLFVNISDRNMRQSRKLTIVPTFVTNDYYFTSWLMLEEHNGIC